jgi:Asp/Glu/hydantoin racemase
VTIRILVVNPNTTASMIAKIAAAACAAASPRNRNHRDQSARRPERRISCAIATYHHGQN